MLQVHFEFAFAFEFVIIFIKDKKYVGGCENEVIYF